MLLTLTQLKDLLAYMYRVVTKVDYFTQECIATHGGIYKYITVWDCLQTKSVYPAVCPLRCVDPGVVQEKNSKHTWISLISLV